MDSITLSRDQLYNAIHLVATMVISDLSKRLNVSPTEMFMRFMESKTAEILYEEETKFWWDGPAAVENEYLEEISNKKVI